MKTGEIKRLMAVLVSAYPTVAIGQSTVDLYAKLLADQDVEDLLRAAREHIAVSRFFPTIAELRALVSRSHTGGLEAGELAWGEVRRLVRLVGRNRTPKFSDGLVAAAVDAIGWQDICNADEQSLPTVRAQFRNAYEALVAGARREDNLASLEGRAPRALPGAGNLAAELHAAVASTAKALTDGTPGDAIAEWRKYREGQVYAPKPEPEGDPT